MFVQTTLKKRTTEKHPSETGVGAGDHKREEKNVMDGKESLKRRRPWAKRRELQWPNLSKAMASLRYVYAVNFRNVVKKS